MRCFEERLAALEGGAACVATASGMGAILATCMALLKTGDPVVCSDSVFGSTTTLLNRYIGKFGVERSLALVFPFSEGFLRVLHPRLMRQTLCVVLT